MESPHFSKPAAAFIGDALFGIQASEVKLASWVKLLNCRAKPKEVEDRLSRHLSLEGMDRKIQRIVMEDSRGKVHGNKGIYVYDCGGDNIELFRYFTGTRTQVHRPPQAPKPRQLGRDVGLGRTGLAAASRRTPA